MISEFDPHAYALQRIRSLRPEFEWSHEVDAAWTERLRGGLASAIGAVNDPPCALDARHGELQKEPDFTIRQVDFASREGVRVYGYWLEPDGAEDAPAILCVPGHGAGVDALVGLAPADYQNQFALQCVRHGYRVLAIEPCSFGHRRSAIETESSSSCHRDGTAALMLGETLVGWRVRDAMASIDFARSMGADRVGIMGISGGGLVALWTAALDLRIDAAVVSGYFNTFADSILSIHHCVDNFVPGLSKIVEMPDMAALIAPRPLFVESGNEDPIFPAESFRTACERARAIYNGSDNFQSHLFEGDHSFSGEQAFPFLDRWLR